MRYLSASSISVSALNGTETKMEKYLSWDSLLYCMSQCGQHCDVYSRVCGYMRPVSSWNDAKQAEFTDRKTYVVG